MLTLDEAEMMLMSGDKERIEEWNRHHLKKEHPREWTKERTERGRGLTLGTELNSPLDLHNIRFHELDFGGPLALTKCEVFCGEFTTVDANSIKLLRCRFESCRFADLKWCGVNIDHCEFVNCIFERCVFSHSILTHTDIIGPCTRLHGCDLSNCEFSSFTLKDATAVTCSFDYSFVAKTSMLNFFGAETCSFDGSQFHLARIAGETGAGILQSQRTSYWRSFSYNPSNSRVSRISWAAFWLIFGYHLSIARIALVSCLIAILYSSVLAFTPLHHCFPQLSELNKQEFSEGFCRGDKVSVENEEKPKFLLCFRFIRAMYFVTVTMTTLGYGDISPERESLAGMLFVCVVVITGQVLSGILVARLISLMTWPE